MLAVATVAAVVVFTVAVVVVFTGGTNCPRRPYQIARNSILSTNKAPLSPSMYIRIVCTLRVLSGRVPLWSYIMSVYTANGVNFLLPAEHLNTSPWQPTPRLRLHRKWNANTILILHHCPYSSPGVARACSLPGPGCLLIV